METKTERSKIANVEAGRGIAATLVVLYHCTKYYFATPKYWAGGALDGFFMFGHAGVEFFFVLSGFIMMWIHQSDIGRPDRVGAFVWKRFQRIYPFLWVVLAVTLLLVWRNPALGKPYYRDPLIILQSAALMGADDLRSIVFVSWTLWHEIVFYAFCAVVIALPRIGIPAFALWVVTCATRLAPGYALAFINVLFAFGVIVALALRRWRIPRPGLFLAVGLGIFLATAVAADYTSLLPEWATNLLFGFGSALGLVGAVELERGGRMKAPQWMQVLGAASFAIYLTHMLTLTFFAKAAVYLHLTQILPPLAGFVLLAGSAVLAGVVIHYTVERRVLAAAAAARKAVLAVRARKPAPPLPTEAAQAKAQSRA